MLPNGFDKIESKCPFPVKCCKSWSHDHGMLQMAINVDRLSSAWNAVMWLWRSSHQNWLISTFGGVHYNFNSGCWELPVKFHNEWDTKLPVYSCIFFLPIQFKELSKEISKTLILVSPNIYLVWYFLTDKLFWKTLYEWKIYLK